MKFKPSLPILIFSSVFFISSCGGGSSSKTDTNEGNNNQTTETTNTAPVTLIDLLTDEPRRGEATLVSASNSFDSDGDPISYSWEIVSPSGKVQTIEVSDSNTLNFVPDEVGQYKLTLKVTDDKGAHSSKSIDISVENGQTSANQSLHAEINLASNNTKILPMDAVSLSGNKSYDPNGGELAYSWAVTQYPANSEFAFSAPTNVSTLFSADSVGSYEVTLTVSSGDLTESVTKVIIVESEFVPLDAQIDMISEVKSGNTVFVSAEKSVFNSNTKIRWYFASKPNNSNAKFSAENQIESSFVPDIAGDYVVGLELTTEFDFSNSEKVLKVTDDTTSTTGTNGNLAPEAKITAKTDWISLNNSLVLSAADSVDPDNDKLTYSWKVTSKADDTAIVSLSTQTEPQTEFKANTTGKYVVELTVSDGELKGTKEFTVTVTMRNQVPLAAINVVNKSFDQGETVTFYGLVSDDSKDHTYKWILISKPTNSKTELTSDDAINTQVYLDLPGTYIVGFTATDWEFTSEQTTRQITAGNNLPPVVTKVSYDSTSKVNNETTVSVEATDPEGSALQFTWKIVSKPNESSLVLPNTTNSTLKFTPDAVGWYTLSVEANDGIQSSSIPWQFVINVID